MYIEKVCTGTDGTVIETGYVGRNCQDHNQCTYKHELGNVPYVQCRGMKQVFAW
jgi:hypothetical protein